MASGVTARRICGVAKMTYVANYLNEMGVYRQKASADYVAPGV
jgi:hypothetical protein